MDIDKAALHFEGKKYTFRQARDGMVLSFLLHPDDMPVEMATSPIGTRYMVACVEINDVEEPVIPRARTDGERAMARSIMICREDSYQDWIRLNAERWNLDPDMLPPEEFAAHVIKLVCHISSRSELQTNAAARERLAGHLRTFEDDIA